MVRLQLSIKAELEGVTDFVPASKDFEYFFNVKCTSCHEQHPNAISINRVEERELTHGKGSTAHFVWKCGLCKRESSAKFETPDPIPYSIEKNGQFQPLLVVECRGLEFTDFDPRGEWKAVGEKGEVFTVDLAESDGEWVDYDEKAHQPIGISKFEASWDRAQ